MAKSRLWVTTAILAVLILPLAVDGAIARRRLDHVSIETSLDPPSVVADGKSEAILTIRVVERGRPRSHDLLQLWLETGSGLLRPEWVFTDDNGIAEVKYTSNPASPYDVADAVQIHIADISIGKLLEVRKHKVVTVPLVTPK